MPETTIGVRFEMARVQVAWMCPKCGRQMPHGATAYFGVQYPDRLADVFILCGGCAVRAVNDGAGAWNA